MLDYWTDIYGTYHHDGSCEPKANVLEDNYIYDPVIVRQRERLMKLIFNLKNSKFKNNPRFKEEIITDSILRLFYDTLNIYWHQLCDREMAYHEVERLISFLELTLYEKG